MTITRRRVEEIVSFDPMTGIFRWKYRPGTTIPADKRAGSRNSHGYVKLKLDGHDYAGHRIAWLMFYGTWPPMDIDHINGRRDDNRISNLRLATKQQNNANSRRLRTNRIGMKGVTASGRDTYRARISIDGRQVTLGTFPSASAAHDAYCAAALRLHGAFANPG